MHWFRDFCEQYKKRINLPFSCNLRADLVNEEAADLLKYAGCFQVKMGIESGNDYIRNEILKRRLSIDEIKKAYALCKKRGLGLVSYNMVGMPFEKRSEMLETVKLNAQAHIRRMGVSIFYPYQGSDLYKLCREKSYLTDDKLPSYFDGSVLNPRLVSREEILFVRNYFEFLVRLYSLIYRLPDFLSKRLSALLDRIICWPHLPVSLLRRVSFLFYPKRWLINLLKRSYE
jgi:radical SAM superfamily enzyme YgiQ (UPF0313 family)